MFDTGVACQSRFGGALIITWRSHVRQGWVSNDQSLVGGSLRVQRMLVAEAFRQRVLGALSQCESVLVARQGRLSSLECTPRRAVMPARNASGLPVNCTGSALYEDTIFFRNGAISP